MIRSAGLDDIRVIPSDRIVDGNEGRGRIYRRVVRALLRNIPGSIHVLDALSMIQVSYLAHKNSRQGGYLCVE